MRSKPGTPTARPPVTTSLKGKGLPLSMNRSCGASTGAVSRPSNTCNCRPSWCSKNAPPPIPLDCGSTKVNTICTAIAASTAEPPACKIRYPASLANGCAAATPRCFNGQPGLSVQPLDASGCTLGDVCATTQGVKKAVAIKAKPPHMTRRRDRMRSAISAKKRRFGCIVLLGWQTDGTIEPDHLAIEHVIVKNMHHQFGVIMRRAKA